MPSALARTLLFVGVFAIAAAPAAGMDLPPGFQARTLPLPKATAPTYANGLQKPTTIDFAPDGKLFVAERNGRVLEFDSTEDPTPTLVLSILDKVMAKGDRGILGMKLDPEYPTKPFLYLSYTYDAPIGGDYKASTHPHLADGADECVEEKLSGDCLVSGRLARVEIDPATSLAVGGPVDPGSEQVLINSWCQQTTSHSVGDIEFDAEGALLMSGGEGASWGSIDYGQLGNYCADPEFEGGSLRAQDLRTPATPVDQTDYSGSIIRVDRETGAALPNNPLSLEPLFGAGVEDAAAKRILAEGLRNPYRFTIQPGTGEIYLGEVGQDLWEEIDHFSPPPATGVGLINFGWPCFEGGRTGNLKMPRWQAAEGEIHKPLCAPLYSNPSQVTAPLFAYPHANAPGFDGHLFEGDACDPTPGSATSGIAFYDPSGVPAEAALPGEYDGALFFADAARGCIWTMLQGLNGVPDPATVANFALPGEGEVFTPVDIVEGADGALYVPNFYGDSIVEIRYFPGNQAPDARLSASATYGPAPLSVNFDASGSTDPDLGEGDSLHYAWDLDGDGEFDDGEGPTAFYEYTDPVNVTAKVRVSDDFNHVSVAEQKLYPGDLGPPQVEIKAPTSGFKWTIGEPVPYEAAASDPDGDEFGSPANPLTAHWEFTLKHCPVACHEHPITSADELSGSFIAPPHDPPVHLELEFTATDSRGLSDSEVVEIFPREVEVTVVSDPAGLPLGINGVSAVAPLESTVIAGGTATVSAPETATVEGATYLFDGWSDGGAPVHEADTSEDVELVATYLPELGEPEPEEPEPEEPEPEVPGPGGGSTSPPPVLSPPPVDSPPATARVKLASRPPGAKLGLGAVRKIAPFAAEVQLGTRTFLVAPKTIRRHGRAFRFSRWMGAGRGFGTSPRQGLTISGAASYLAVYVAAAPQRPHGGR
jgi:glucose/arabinose dehydrogenase